MDDYRAEIVNVYESELGQSVFVKMPNGWIVTIHTYADNKIESRVFNTYSAAMEWEHEMICEVLR